MILVVDYGLGNLLSVSKAFEEIAGKKRVVVSQNPDMFHRVSHIVLPGAGNFQSGMKNLKELGLLEPLVYQVTDKATPFLGICLGMHLLAEIGEEFGETPGLGLVPGQVKKINGKGAKMPHIGWNDLNIINPIPLFRNISPKCEFYFVHGYRLHCRAAFVTATCSYGETFPSAIQKDNIFATQFHPEKSREAGLKILKNFLEI